jgi:hypothetical protein
MGIFGKKKVIEESENARPKIIKLAETMVGDQPLEDLGKIVGEGNTLLIFSGKRCAPCHMMEDMIERESEIAAQIKKYGLKLVKINDHESYFFDALNAYGAKPMQMSVPQVSAWHEGEFVGSFKTALTHKGMYMKQMKDWYNIFSADDTTLFKE